jgi:hypothetical protein
MATVQARIKFVEGRESLLPVVVPEASAVRDFAAALHAEGKAWQGEAFGWQAEYVPESPLPPLHSRLSFTPAEFCIGESGVWFLSLAWERGRDAPPIEYVDDSGIVGRPTS